MQARPVEPAGTATLKPTVADKHAGLVGIASGFDLKRYPVMAVTRFAVNRSEVHDAEDQRLAAVMPEILQSELVGRLRQTRLFTRVVDLGEGRSFSSPERVLRLEGTLTRLAPGSRLGRYFGGDPTKVQAEMWFVDAGTGEVVMLVATRRHGTGAWQFFGGDSEQLMRDSVKDIAEDIGKFLARLAKGEAPSN